MSHALVLLACFAAVAADEPTHSPAKAQYLRCEYRVNPLGIDVLQPRLSWEMQDARRGAAQTAYQVLVASSPEKLAAGEGDLWDSGRVASSQSSQVVYAGKPLASRMRCSWKVRLWDAQGRPTADSEPALWTMGLLEPKDIQAKWIGIEGRMVHPAKSASMDLEGCSWIWFDEKGVDPRVAAPKGTRFFHGSATIPAGRRVARATFLIAADDSYELYVNGHPASKGTGWNNPQLADVTNHLNLEKNRLAIEVTNASPGPAGLIGKLKVDFVEGEPLVVPIDGSWKATDKEITDWEELKIDSSAWPAVKVIAKLGDQPWGKVKASAADVLGCPQFRKEFTVAQPIRRATVYASALGLYRLEINGQPVANDYFTPDWTDYNIRVYYNTYDVTDLARGGGLNAIGGTLAAGWYAGAIGWKTEHFNYGTDPKLLVQLELELADGTRQIVASDASWKTAFGPYVEGEFLAGEYYDARREMPGWSRPNFQGGDWKPVRVTDTIGAKLEAFPGVTVQETGVLEPISITEPEPKVFVFDMGQNYAGFVRLKVKGPKGTKVVLRFAEMLNPDGTIYTTNLRGARATDTYVLKGEEEEVWQPRFTFHGFRYVEVTGYPERPSKEAITGIALNSATPLVGSFQCSNPMVNQLYRNIVWTQRANFISVPTDCPQRDERLGWTGDAQVFIRAATYNADTAAFYTKWLVDLEDAQTKDGGFTDVAPIVLGLGAGTAAWADAGTICPWTTYWVYNDTRVLQKHYDAMVRWVDYCKRHSKGLLRPAEGYGDWLSINADTPKDVLATAYFAYSTDLTAKTAHVLGREAEARQFEGLFQEIKSAFNKAYVSADGHVKGNTQTGYVLALWFNLLPEDKRPAAQRYLVEDIQNRAMHLSTGFNGTAYLMPTLAAIGHNDVAYRLLLNDTFPSWGYSIKHGATSIWERWDGWTAEKGFQDPGMNSFAHYSFGAVARWMFQSVAGIDTDGPGFKRLVIRPEPNAGLSWVKASYRSLHGQIATEWNTSDRRLSLAVTIPANTVATVYVPVGQGQKVSESGRPATEAEGVKFLRTDSGKAVYELGAGQYRFDVSAPVPEKYQLPFSAKTREEALLWQQQARGRLLELVGRQEPRYSTEEVPLEVKVGAVEDRGAYTLYPISFQGSNKTGTRYDAILTVPKGQGPFPGMLCLHGHGGSAEKVFKAGEIYHGFADRFARGGYVVLAPSFPHRKYAASTLWDLMRAVDILASRPEVDPKRIGVGGLSMGGEWTMWVAACDPRLNVAVVSGWMCTTDGIFSWPNCACWELPGFADLMDVSEVHLLIAPRALVMESAERDECFPVHYCKEGFRRIQAGYGVFGAGEAVCHDVFPGVHEWHGALSYGRVDQVLGGRASKAQ